MQKNFMTWHHTKTTLELISYNYFVDPIEETTLRKTIQKDCDENLDKIFLKEKFRNVSENNFNCFISNIKDGLRTKAQSHEDSFILSQSESFFAIELKDIYTKTLVKLGR